MYNDYNEFEFEQKSSKRDLIQQRAKKQKQATMLIALLIVGGLAYFFLGYLPEEKTNAKEEIEKKFKEEWNVTTDKLDKNLWEGSENWEEHLESLFLPSQVQAFKEKMLKAIDRKAIELEEEEKDRPQKVKKEAIDKIKNLCNDEELETPQIKEIIGRFIKEVNEAQEDKISDIVGKANGLITNEKDKRQKLYWKIETHNWIDRKLTEMTDVYDKAWNHIKGKGAKKATFAAPYSIKFPSVLWNDLREEEKGLAKANGHVELTLRDDVHTYKFNDKINKWYDKVKLDPIRGEKDSNTKKDNNALFYGTGGTGKSISVEKLAFEANKYPLVVIQGSNLTPKLPDQQANIAVPEKFFFTIADINWTLINDFKYERAEGGEVRYILFLDEADQIYMNSFSKESTGLTFLKECMGSDNYKANESWNLWIAATNHLDKIDSAVYRSGRLSNPLDFSWTLGDFMRYAGDAGIVSQFPQCWLEEKTLDDDDNKWVNRFNKDYFDADFLPFWDKFIRNNPNAEYEPEKDDDSNQQTNTNQQNTDPPKKIKIKWGEFFEFFWKLKDSSQLEHFEGKFTNPRQPKIEQVIEKNLVIAANQISEQIGTKLKELNETAEAVKEATVDGSSSCISAIEDNLSQIKLTLEEIGGRIN